MTWASSGNATQAGTALGNGTTTFVNAISGDGTVIVGSDQIAFQAVKWTGTFTGAPTPLPILAGSNQSGALGVNQTASTIVGYFTTPQNGTSQAIAWNPGAVDITAALAGAPNLASFSLQGALFVASDGHLIVGGGLFNGVNQPWVARLPQ
jgi:uncharacterized membrane protein